MNRAEEGAQRYAERLQIVQEVAWALLAAQSPEEIARAVLSHIRKPVDFERFTEATRQLGFYWLLLNTPCTP